VAVILSKPYPSQALCKSELLKNVSIVLFLNKCDELEPKLALGLRVEDFVQLSSKREAGGDVDSVKSCECILILLSPPFRGFPPLSVV